MTYLKDIYAKIENNADLTRDDALKCLALSTDSEDFYRLTYYANCYAKEIFSGRGFVFSQIGLDHQPCSVNCAFCSMAAGAFGKRKRSIKSLDEILGLVRGFVRAGSDDIFLMTTAEYPCERFLEMGRSVKKTLPGGIRLVANIGDFGPGYAAALRDAGFTGVYHICRLGEGVDTGVPLKQREATIKAAVDAGLELYYCVEPIGPEHTNEQIADEIFRTSEYNVGMMAVMRRTPVPGTATYGRGSISAKRLALICAVTLLCAKPYRTMGVHEPEILSLVSGANQVYAESGSNPRDLLKSTQEGRGFSVEKARKLLMEAGWK